MKEKNCLITNSDKLLCHAQAKYSFNSSCYADIIHLLLSLNREIPNSPHTGRFLQLFRWLAERCSPSSVPWVLPRTLPLWDMVGTSPYKGIQEASEADY